MSGWLVDTLVWTGALMALVLAVRGPVARAFGPAAAYALWFLPLLRLLVPTARVMLPAVHLSAVHVAPIRAPELASAAPLVNSALADTGPTVAAPAVFAFDPQPWLIALWLCGAALVLARRFGAYAVMRRRLLAGARELRRIGRVRVIESAATPMPIAFGVFDPHVAVPEGFFASEDPIAARLALAHELEHHAGGDLWVNLAMQPLFALHWFNPLARPAWRALRSDQETACDARVVAAHGPAHRARYGELLARFAVRGPGGATPTLLSPLACPVGESRSIIHRLRSLAMPQQSHRRRLAGRLLVSTGVLALPLTASITYAASEQPAPPPTAPEAPLPALPPLPPAPPAAHHPGHRVIVIRDHGRNGPSQTRTVTRGDTSITVTTDHPVSDAEIDRMVADAQRDADRARGEAAAARAEAHAEAEAARAQARAALAEAHMPSRTEIIRIQRDARRSAMRSLESMPAIDAPGCRRGATDVATRDPDDRHIIRIRVCGARAAALDGLRHARRTIAESADMPAEGRDRALHALDARISEMETAG